MPGMKKRLSEGNGRLRHSRVGSSYILQKELYTLRMALPDGGEDDGDAVLIFGIDIGAFGHEVTEHVQLAVVCGNT